MVTNHDTVIKSACAQFVREFQQVLPLDGLAVVLLDPEQETSRVVYSWEAPRQASERPYPAGVPQPGDQDVGQDIGRPLSIALTGLKGAVGAILLRSRAQDNWHPRDRERVHGLARQLALDLEYFQLQQRVERHSAEQQALDRLHKITSSPDSPFRRICRQFAGEIKPLIEYHHLMVLLTEPEDRSLSCAYEIFRGVRKDKASSAYVLSNALRGPADLNGAGEIIGDLLEARTAEARAAEARATSEWPETTGHTAGDPRSAVTVPIDYGGKTVGIVRLANRRPHAYGPADAQLLHRAASLLGLPATSYQSRTRASRGNNQPSAIGARTTIDGGLEDSALPNSGFFNEAQRETRQFAAADRVTRTIASARNIDEVYAKFADEVKHLVEFDRASINIIDYENQAFTIGYLFGEEAIESRRGTIRRLEGSLTQIVASSGRTLIRENVGTGPPVTGDAERLKLGLRSNVAVPLVTRGQVVGSLILSSHKADAYGPQHQNILERLAVHIAPAVENAQLSKQAQVTAQEMAVDEVARILSTTLIIEEEYERFAAALRGLVEFDRAALSMIDDAAGTYVLKHLWGPTMPGHHAGHAIALKNSLTAYVAATRQTLVRDDVLKDPTFVGDHALMDSGLRSCIMVPLILKDRMVGSLALRSRTVGAYGAREQAILERLARQIAPAVENAQLYRQLRVTGQEAEIVESAVRVLNSTSHLEEVFGPFAAAITELIAFDRATLSWVDPDGSEISNLEATLTGNLSIAPFAGNANSIIRTHLRFRKGTIGVLALERQHGAFTSQDQELLDRLGEQVALMVHSARLDQYARRQVYRSQHLIARAPSEGQEGWGSLQQDMLAELGHSLRSPLTSIKGYSSTLLQPDLAWSPELQREFLETIDHETDRLNQVVNELLASAQPDSGEFQLQSKDFLPSDLLSSLETSLTGQRRSRTLRFKGDPRLPEVRGDARAILLAVSHLVACADAASAAGAGILVELRREENQVTLFIGPDEANQEAGQNSGPGPEDTPSRQRSAQFAPQAMTLANHELRMVVCRSLLGAQGISLRSGEDKGRPGAYSFALPPAGSEPVGDGAS